LGSVRGKFFHHRSDFDLSGGRATTGTLPKSAESEENIFWKLRVLLRIA
jgi:hypothetical protein